MLGCLARAKHLIPSCHMVTIYKAKIRPLLEYCSSVWGSACDTHLNLLDKVERRAAKIIGPDFKVPYELSTRRAVGGLAFVHKLVKGHGSSELKLLLPPFAQKSNYSWHSNSDHHEFSFQINYCRTDHFKRSFINKYTVLWNTLPPVLANPNISLNVFKTQASQNQKPP